MSDSTPDKNALRRQALLSRRALDGTAAGLAIGERLATWPAFREAAEVLSYHPLASEVDLLPLMERFREKKWYLPRTTDDTEMIFLAYQIGDPLEPHEFGMLEPLAEAPRFSGAPGALVLAPGLMFDRAGARLGYGKGYYDRFLALNPGLVRVGVVPEAFLVPQLPAQPWDVRMHYLATEEGILDVSSV